MDDPRGGVRHCVKGKGYYWTTKSFLQSYSG
jgi:hypothetical protein